MVKTFRAIFVSTLCMLLLLSAINIAAPSTIMQPAQNHPPVVKFISPVNNSTMNEGAQVHYSVTVSDKEDGDSKYDEINSKEVLLEVRYVSDPSKVPSEINKAGQGDAPGLEAMRTSNCFNCHSFTSKVIGPSFNDVNKKYKPTPANLELLAKRIREGSSGVWGNVKMPTHPELSKEQIANIVQWIMHDGSASGVDYYVGTEGSFALPAKKGNYLLRASYVDHGTPQDSTHHLKGQDVLVIKAE